MLLMSCTPDINIENVHANKLYLKENLTEKNKNFETRNMVFVWNSHVVLDLCGISVLHARGCFFLFRGQNTMV